MQTQITDVLLKYAENQIKTLIPILRDTTHYVDFITIVLYYTLVHRNWLRRRCDWEKRRVHVNNNLI